MESTVLTKPGKVSGFIKAMRWGLLIYGMFYGQFQWDRYHSRQEKIREEREKMRPAIEARKRAEVLAKLTDDLKQAATDFGIELPPGWTAEGY